MKKVFLLFMILGFTSISFLDLKASSYQGITLDTSISDLNNYTLREVFRDYNNFDNGSFDDGLTSWNVQPGNPDIEIEVINGELTIISVAPDPGSVYVYQFINFIQDNDYYIRFDYNIIDGDLAQWLFDGWISVGREFLLSGSLVGESEYSKTFTPLNSGTDGYFIGLTASDIFDIIKLDNFVLVDLTSLGITLSQTLLDYYYDIYFALYNNIDLDTFYNQGLGVGYGNGLEDYHDGFYNYLDPLEGVPYNTGYNEGLDYAVQNNISILSIFELIFGVALNMLTFIITIDVFGISILSIISVLSLMIGAVWILKMIRG